jgi:hypothetical protein
MSMFEDTRAALASEAPAAPRVRRPWANLLRAVLELAGPEAELVSHAERSWRSVTFCGTRHEVVLRFAGLSAIDQGEDFIAALPEHEFAIPRQIVADATIREARHEALPEPKLEVVAELLLVEDS